MGDRFSQKSLGTNAASARGFFAGVISLRSYSATTGSFSETNEGGYFYVASFNSPSGGCTVSQTNTAVNAYIITSNGFTTTNYGVYVSVSGTTSDWGIYVNSADCNFLGRDNIETYWGTGLDCGIYYDGTDMCINPRFVGSGVVDFKYPVGAAPASTTPAQWLDIQVNGTAYKLALYQ